MNQKLQSRMFIGSAAALVVSYFLPWMNVTSPFATTELRGQFIDCAWVLLVFGISSLAAHFARVNSDAFELPSSISPKLALVERITPILVLGFVV